MLSDCTYNNLNTFQLVQNAAGGARKFDHILARFHWLPINFGIDYKILLLTNKCLNSLVPEYLFELISCYEPPCSSEAQNAGSLLVPTIMKATAHG